MPPLTTADDKNVRASSATPETSLSSTFDWLKNNSEWGDRLVIPEWESEDYRKRHGWQGNDLAHSTTTSPVRIEDYFVTYSASGGAGTRLTGKVVFTENAESHQGYCHGGSMCLCMDDVVGWLGFCVTGECKPWSGYTVQINTRLMKPIPVGSSMVVTAIIDRVERRKVFITAHIVNVQGETVVEHARCEGVVVVNKEVFGS